MRDEKRTFICIPPKIAPIKCSILPVVSAPKLIDYCLQIKTMLTKFRISAKVDDTGTSIGKRYARTDEVGIPYGITIDDVTEVDQTVTLRELETMKQIRIHMNEVPKVISDLVENFISWSDILKKYPIFVIKDDKDDN